MLVGRAHLDSYVDFLARLHGALARVLGALAREGDHHLRAHLVATDEGHLGARRPRHLADVLQAPDLGERRARRHLSAVEDGDVAHKARCQLRAAGGTVSAAAPAASTHASTRTDACLSAAAAVGAPAPHAGAPAERRCRGRRCKGGGLDGLIVSLVLVGELVILGLAQVVVVALEVVAHAHDRAHARAVALDARVDVVRVGSRCWRWDPAVERLLLGAQLVILRLAHVVVVPDEVVAISHDGRHARAIARDADVHSWLGLALTGGAIRPRSWRACYAHSPAGCQAGLPSSAGRAQARGRR